MLNLIKKDFLLQKKSIYFAIGYSIFIFFAFQDPTFSDFKYVMGGTAISYILIMTAAAHEEKNNSDIILNSLPITRKTIIQSRYLMFIVATFLTLLIVGTIGFVFSLIGFPKVERFISLGDILTVFVSVSLLSSIYYPLFIKFGSKYMRIFNIILFMVIFFTPSFLVSYLMENESKEWAQNIIIKLESISVAGYYSFAVIFVVSILLISYLVSLRIYENKEF